ncbi:hypothetical protein ATZ36_05060 [Candidatus Endomicrobiellum trichonymphae]|uniref:Uncharacterized protein n=1 Tax=Endomicrobium trichonymphae TaxID=1408204 RepID=A0A1E5IIP4_ENDTX|nr:hypothetical protein ATZ36_05060 [Candidatus Endomicrobium trichonymphae]
MLVRDEAEYYQLCFAIKSFEKSLVALISNGVEIVEYIDFSEDTDVDDTARSFIGMRVLYPFLELIKYRGEKDKLSAITQDLFNVVQSRYIEIKKYSSLATYTLNLISYMSHTADCKFNDVRKIILDCIIICSVRSMPTRRECLCIGLPVKSRLRLTTSYGSLMLGAFPKIMI